MLLVVALFATVAPPVWGASPIAPVPSSASSASSAAAALDNSVPASDLQKLVDTLKNDKDRTQLIQQLQTLIAAQQAAPEAQSTPGIIEGLTSRFQGIGSELLEVAGIARAAPKLVGWFERQVRTPAMRTRWLEIFLRLIVVFGAAVVAGLGAGRLLRPLRARFAQRPGETFPKWLVLFIVTLILNLLPIAVFAAVATLVLAALQPDFRARLIAAAVISAIIRAEAILITLRVFLISPATPPFLRLGEESRAYLYIWMRRFAVWAVYGFGVARIAWALGAPGAVQALLMRFTIIVLAGFAIVFVLQNRGPVSAWLRDGRDPTPPRLRATTGTLRLARNALADTWHIIAVVYILGSFGTYLVDLHGGAGFVLRATVLSVLVLAGAGLVMRLIRHLDQRGFTLNADIRARFPGLEGRTNKYLPAMVFVVSAAVYVVALILLLQAWGVDALAWVAHQYVRDVAGTVLSIAIVVVIAIAVWELISAAVERALGGGGAGRQAMVSARLRTLLPLVRSTVLIAIVAVAGFIVLSQIGVDIAPLLAGAGIVGIAVGLGSQALVKDVINGLFILIENTVIIGDYVDVGGGHAGTVEDISIRSMRLRDGAGAVHTIPFSSVTALTNTNRGIGNAAVSVNVALGEDTDRVSRILIEIAGELRRDPAFQAMMLSDFQLWGVDKVDGAMATIAGQIVCTDGGRWPVQREFNRRMKQRFQEDGIAFALPTQNLIVREIRKEPEPRSESNRQITPLRAPRDRG
jgi:small conductance mechanosensitive channel